MKKIQQLKDSKNRLRDIISFFEGSYRYNLYYSTGISRYLMRKHIREQIDFRISVMNPKCYEQGSCVICGCDTTALQMANKPCEGMEYPPLMTKERWHNFRNERVVVHLNSTSWHMYLGTLVRIVDTGANFEFTEIKRNLCIETL